jgi:hypothetical protein
MFRHALNGLALFQRHAPKLDDVRPKDGALGPLRRSNPPITHKNTISSAFHNLTVEGHNLHALFGERPLAQFENVLPHFCLITALGTTRKLRT